MSDTATPQARKRATTAYRGKSLANINLVISHTEPEVLVALEEIMSYHTASKAGAIKRALVEYAKTLK